MTPKARLVFLACLLGALAGAPSARAERPASPDEIRGESTVAFHPAPEGSQPVRGDWAVIALLGDVDSLNPYTSSSASASEIQEMIFPRLFHEEADYGKGPPTFTPELAESVTFGDDGLTLHVRLREATWSDGKPITSDDVRFSWLAARNPVVAWVNASIVDFIEDVVVEDARNFTVKYSKRYPYQQMDLNDVQILPKHVFDQVPLEKWQGYGTWEEQAKVGGGPFVLEKLTPSQSIALVRNPRYWKAGKPYLDKVVFRIIPDLRTQLTSVLAGDVDCMQSVLPKDVDRVLSAPHLYLYTYVTRSYGYVGWNCATWPFDDAAVRRAMSHAIDVEDMVEAIFRGYAAVAGPQIIRSMWASDPDIHAPEFDPDKAEALLEGAGWKKNGDGIFEKDGKPFRFTLITNSENDLRLQMCQMIKTDLQDIGVEAVVKPVEFNQMSTQLKHHDFQAYVGGWYVATKVDLKPIWHSESVNGQFNFVGFKNARVDEIIDQARVMSDFEKAKPLWFELQEILSKEQPYTMLYEPRGLVALNKRFQNVKVTAHSAYDNIDEWWVPKDEQRFGDR